MSCSTRGWNSGDRSLSASSMTRILHLWSCGGCRGGMLQQWATDGRHARHAKDVGNAIKGWWQGGGHQATTCLGDALGGEIDEAARRRDEDVDRTVHAHNVITKDGAPRRGCAHQQGSWHVMMALNSRVVESHAHDVARPGERKSEWVRTAPDRPTPRDPARSPMICRPMCLPSSLQT